MSHTNRSRTLRLAPKAAGFALATVLPLAINTASAFELDFGAVQGSLDSTVSYGAAWRTEAPEKDLSADYATYPQAVAANRRTFINKNDGDANFDNDSRPISSVFKITSDLELKYENVGIFTRGTAFYDTVLMDEEPNRASPNRYPNSASCNVQNTANFRNCGFPSEIDEHSGHDLRFLDAYLYGNFEIGKHALNVRLGEQVVSWGEALFLQDGINSANPVSLSKLRLPGAEVKEALLPLPMVYASLGLTDNLTFETFYQFDWDYSEPDDAGTFYSTDEAFAGLGSNSILIDMEGGSAQALAMAYNQAKYGVASPVLTYDRLADKEVDSDGQFGAAFRLSMESTELGLFFMNYHSHKPVAQATAGQAGGGGALAAAAYATSPSFATCRSFGLTLAQTLAGACGGVGGPAQIGAQQLVGGANAINYLDTTTYQLVYPEDIQMYGISFSTTAGDLSISGELAYRPNDVILAELGDNLVAYNTLNAAILANGGSASAGTAGDGKTYRAGEVVRDWVELETYNADFVVINNFGPLLGADGVTGALELGASYVPEGEDQRYASTASLLNIPRSSVPTASQTGCTGPVYEAGTCLSEGPSDDYLDELSWGYRMVLSATYNDVFAGVALTPVLRFAHDVDGNSHRTGNFLENRKAGTVGLNALYNQVLEVGVAYNAFWGAEASNLLHDRDNLTASIKYSF